MEPENTSDTGFDLDSAMDNIAASDPADLTVTDDGIDNGAAQETPDKSTTSTETAAPVARQPPKSWAKEQHESWAKVDPKVQEYIEKREKDFLDGLEQYKGDSGFARQVRDVLTPYQPMLQSLGMQPHEAVGRLLNAQFQLTNGTAEQRNAAYAKLGQELGLSAPAGTENGAAPIDPTVKELRERLGRIESGLTQRQQAELREAQARTSSEVEAFASDAANPYFDEVATDMLPFINSGMALKDAYERAIWANPVTRAKEQARIQTESEAKTKENARLDALKARKAAGANVRGAESLSAPTEPKGKLFDDMPDILKEIKARVN